MSGKGGSEEKTLPASARKLREARKKGQIAHSREMVTAVVAITGVAYLWARAGALFDGLQAASVTASDLTAAPFDESVTLLVRRLGVQVLWMVGPLIGLVIIAAVLANVAVNGGALASLDPVLPKMERLDPIEGFKRLLSMRNLIDLIKSVLKVLLIGSVAAAIVALSLQDLVEQPSCGVSCAAPVLRGLLRPLLIAACGFFLVLGVFDIGLQRWLFGRDMKMTKTEQKRERKEMDGDPLIKNQHRREQRAGLRVAVRTGLRNATFVIRSADLVLAFRYAKPDAMVPVLVARAMEDGAPVLLDEARAARLPIVLDAGAARAFSRLRVGQMIGKESFGLVIGCMRQAGIM